MSAVPFADVCLAAAPVRGGGDETRPERSPKWRFVAVVVGGDASGEGHEGGSHCAQDASRSDLRQRNSCTALDLTGQRFGSVLVVERLPNDKWNRTHWLIECVCGNRKSASSQHLRKGSIKTCGCRGVDVRIEERHRAEYKLWCNIKQRCTNPRCKDFRNYGGRGIQICERWASSFEAFLADVGARPGPELSLDRYPNNDGHYEPGNVRWATTAQQNANRRPRTAFFLKDRDGAGTHRPAATLLDRARSNKRPNDRAQLISVAGPRGCP